MLYTDLVKTQFSSMVKKNDSDILTSILWNLDSFPSFDKESLSSELLATLNILGFDDLGKTVALQQKLNDDVLNYALQTVCC
jgi:hypothetical protein